MDQKCTIGIQFCMIFSVINILTMNVFTKNQNFARIILCLSFLIYY